MLICWAFFAAFIPILPLPNGGVEAVGTVGEKVSKPKLKQLCFFTSFLTIFAADVIVFMRNLWQRIAQKRE